MLDGVIILVTWGLAKYDNVICTFSDFNILWSMVYYAPNFEEVGEAYFFSLMHQSFVTPAPPPPHLVDSGATMRDNDLLSSPAVPGKCRACDIT